MFPERPMKRLTQGEWREFNRATKCHICFKDCEEDYRFNYKVRDHHCHYTGLYRGPAHRICNLRYKIPRYIPVVSHNLSGYNTHLFIGELGKKFDSGSIGVIAENKEKYISFTLMSSWVGTRIYGVGLRKRKFNLDLLTALGLWRVAWTRSLEIWMGIME